MTGAQLSIVRYDRLLRPGLPFSRRAGFLLRLETTEGPSGQGEVAPLPEFGTETLARAAEALVAAQAAIASWRLPDATCGATPAQAISALCGLLQTLPVRGVPATYAGLETCLLDAMSRYLSMPLARLLGGEARSVVPVNALAVGPDVLESARHAVAAGFKTVKVKVGDLGAGEAARLLATLRSAVGPEIRLRADAARAWTPAAARGCLRDIADLAIDYVEEPCDRLDALLTRVPGARVAADESACPAPRAWQWLERQILPPVFILKPMLFGGLLEARRFALAARDRGAQVVVTAALDGEIGLLAAAHLAASLPGDLPDCGLVGSAGDPARPGAPAIHEGLLSLPPGPGLGLEVPIGC